MLASLAGLGLGIQGEMHQAGATDVPPPDRLADHIPPIIDGRGHALLVAAQAPPAVL